MNHPIPLGGATAEAMLLESGERYRQLIEVAPVGIFVHCEGRIVLANPAMAKLFRARSVDELLGREVLELVSPVSRELVRERMRQLYETPQTVPLTEVDFVRLDGTHFTVEATAVSFRDAGRAAAQVVARDVTDRKATERALRASEQRFRALATLSSDWFWEQDAELRFVMTSGRTPFRGGISEYDHVGKLRWELPNTEVLGQTWDDHRAVLAARASFHDVMLRRTTPEGTFYIAVSGEPHYDAAGNFAGYRGVAKNITGRYQIEQALRETEARLRATLDAAPAAICLYDREERILTANEGYLRLMERPSQQIAGHTLRATIGEEGYAYAKPHIDRSLAGEANAYERRRRLSDGSRRDLHIQLAPCRDDSENVIGACAMIVDVTEFKETQRRLEASEARFRALTELSSDWYWEQDEAFRYTFFSADLERIGGFSIPTALGLQRWEMPTIGVSQKEWDEHRATLSAHKPFRDFQYQVANAKGEVLWVASSGTPIFDMQGQFRGYRGIGRNITQRKRAEAALRQTSEQYQALVNSIDGIVWEADPATFAFTFVSGQAERLLGYPLRQWLDEPDFWRTHTHPQDVGWATDFCLRATAELRNHEFEYRMIAADGRTVWLRDLVSVVIEHGVAVKLRGVMFDVTDRREAEAALRKSEERFRSLTKLSSDFYWETDTEHRFVSMVFGKSVSDGIPVKAFLGHKRWEIPHAAPGEEEWRVYREMVEARKPIRAFRLARCHPSGDLRHYEIDGDPMVGDAGEFLGYRGVGRDITERLNAERALQLSEQRVRALLRRLTSAQEAERRRVAGDLHDLVGQNLTALGIRLTTLAAELAQAGNHPYGTQFEEMGRLVNDTIDAVRRTMSDLHPSLLDDYGIVAALESHARQFSQRTGVAVTVESQPMQSRPAQAVELALFRIAQEALANAAKHAQASRIRVSLSHGGGFLQLAVEDNGAGFSRGLAQPSEHRGGWGLPLMRERAAEAGGTLHIVFPGQGTRIVAKIPHVDSRHPR